MKKSILSTLLILFFGSLAIAQTIPPDSLYLGQTPPGNTPQIFGPGIISLPGRTEYGISISPAGDEMLFALGSWPNKRTMIIKYQNNHWTTPDTASFSTTRSAEEAIYSPDGQRVYYYAYNPPNPVGGADLCYSVKVGPDWGEPVNLGTPLNTSQDEYHPCVVADSSVYFENWAGKICYSEYQNGAYLPRVLLPPMFNDPNMAWGNPYVSPDESYFIFNSSRPGGFGGTDLYIAYKKNDGTWTNPKNLGDIINTPANENGAEITDDSLYLTYVSANDIYWVGSGFIDSLKYTNFVPYVLNVIPDQTAIKGEMFSFTIPDSTFFDDDGNNTLSYSAKLASGDPLPDWLTFDPGSATFSGIPPVIETLNIRVTAADIVGAYVTTNFRIIVMPHTSINKTEGNNNGVKIFPNPSFGLINISLNSTGNTAMAEICNQQGKIIQSNTFKNFTCIDISNSPKGIYFLRLLFDDEISVSKICVQ